MILNGIFNIITKSAERGCPPNYVPYETTFDGKTIRNCMYYPDIDPNLFDEGYKGGVSKTENKIYVKKMMAAKSQTIASGLNCPPGTFPFEGLCHKSCPKFYKKQMVLRTQEEIDAARKAKKSLAPLYTCVAECSQDWHEMNWHSAVPGISKWNSQTMDNELMCYHKLPQTTSAHNSPEYKELANIPHTLNVTTTKVADDPDARKTALEKNKEYFLLNPKEKTFDPLPVMLYEAAGLYAERRKFPLGSAELPVPCAANNIITASGKCVLPCPAGMTLIGEACVSTATECPAGTVDDTTKSYCIPDKMDMPMGPSILMIFAIAVMIAAIGGVAVKAIRAARN